MPQTGYGYIPDFSQLAEIGQNLGRGYQKRQIRDALSSFNGDYNAAATEMMRLGHPEIASRLYGAGVDAMYRNESLELDRARLSQPPEPTAAQRDANYFAQLSPGDPRLKYAPRGNSKPLNRQVVNDLATKGELAFKINHLAETFQDQYGGFKSKQVGDIANLAARNLGMGDEGAASWWQEYDKHKNVIRNQLFGSALTSQEAAQWERADINPGMTPQAVRRNLDIQRQAAQRAARKLAKVYQMQGADQELIEEALGIPMENLEVAPQPTNNTQAPIPTPVPTMNVIPEGAMTPTVQATAGGGGQQFQQPSPDKVNLLRQYSHDPDAVAAFEEIYGPGSAEQYLFMGQ
jgi:hypothetical protein